jgi:hypothetical protein
MDTFVIVTLPGEYKLIIVKQFDVGCIVAVRRDIIKVSFKVFRKLNANGEKM